MDLYLRLSNVVDPGTILRFRDNLNSVSLSNGTSPLSYRSILTVGFPGYLMFVKLSAGVDVILQHPPWRSIMPPRSNDCGYEPSVGLLISSTIKVRLIAEA